MKVIELLSQELDKVYMEKIINNVDNEDDLYREALDSAEEELLTLFDWDTSPEGFEFWSNLFESLMEKSKLNDEKLGIKRIRIEYFPNTTLFSDDHMYMYNMGDMGIDVKLGFESDFLDNIPGYTKDLYFAALN